MSALRDSIDITATCDAAFAAISQLEEMGTFSPENTGGAWLGGATGPAVGARFKGTNSNGSKSWTTTAKVVECTAPTTFAFDVSVGPFKVAAWRYDLEEIPGGVRVTESWTDRRSSFATRASKGIVADRESFTRSSIRTTLENLKNHLEG
jgi:hypothetical protein